MLSEESSGPRATVRFANRGSFIPAACAKVSNSQSPEFSCRAHGEGWSTIKSSSSVFRALKTFSVFVETFIPGSTGRTHAADKTRAPVSTRHNLQTPTGVSFCKWQSVGIETPFIRAASKTVVPAGTRIAVPSIVMSTSPVGVAFVAILSSLYPQCSLLSVPSGLVFLFSRPDPHSIRFTRSCRGAPANSARTLSAQDVRVHLRSKMFQHRLNRRRHNLPKPANRSLRHRVRQFIQ